MRARFYNQDLRRFVNIDPLRDGTNWYAYANGNPISNVDPSGTFAIITTLAIGAVTGAASGVISHGVVQGAKKAISKVGEKIASKAAAVSSKAAEAARQQKAFKLIRDTHKELTENMSINVDDKRLVLSNSGNNENISDYLDEFSIHAHGDLDELVSVFTEKGDEILVDDLIDFLFEYEHYNGQNITTNICHSGSTGIAQKLSNVFNVRVRAPKGISRTLYKLGIYFSVIDSKKFEPFSIFYPEK